MPPSMRASSSTRSGADKAREIARHAVAAARLGDAEVRVGERGDLREVGDAQHLPPRPEGLQQASDGRGHRAADAAVHFVEDQRGNMSGLRPDDLDRERDPR